MTKNATKIKSLVLKPLTPETWDDFEALFGEKGACGGCWCMSWRLAASEFESQKGEANKKAMRAIVDSGEVPGLIAYADGKPAAWCSVAPRERFPKLGRSRVLAPIDEKPVWSVVCFFVSKPFRGIGLSVEILKHAVKYCKSAGAQIVEGYPSDPRGKKLPDAFMWKGALSAYLKAGFEVAASRSEASPIVRFIIKK